MTAEEARMAVAENLKATHVVDERVRRVATTVETIDNRVANVDDRVVGVDGRVAGIDDKVIRVDDRVAGMDNKMARIDNKVDEIIDGAHIILSQIRMILNTWTA